MYKLIKLSLLYKLQIPSIRNKYRKADASILHDLIFPVNCNIIGVQSSYISFLLLYATLHSFLHSFPPYGILLFLPPSLSCSCIYCICIGRCRKLHFGSIHNISLSTVILYSGSLLYALRLCYSMPFPIIIFNKCTISFT